jgi:hypothetical protein
MPLPREELLHHIWQHRLFNQTNLQTTDGRSLEVLRPGTLNQDAGPDFSNVRLRIDGVEWAGNVEIHIRTSDWLKHGHQTDNQYSSIILHAVFENDLEEALGNFPTLVLKPYVSDQLLKRHENLVGSKAQLPCGNLLLDVPELVRNGWFDSLLVERLQRKSEYVNKLIEDCNGDLEQAFQMLVFRTMGMKVNADAFEQLGRTIPWKVLAKHQNSLGQLEAILFGVSGLLSNTGDEYQKGLIKEFSFLQHKYGLGVLDNSRWKFLRLRPSNFPTIRIAQLAALIHHIGPLLNWFSSFNPNQDFRKLKVHPSTYWETHYTFGKTSSPKPKRIGESAINNLIINAVAPFFFVQAKRQAKPELHERAIDLLQSLRPEQNTKTKAFADVALKVQSAADSQALIELKSNYCDHKKCLICSIGINILKQEK